MINHFFKVLILCLIPFTLQAQEKKDVEAQKSYVLFFVNIHLANLEYLTDVASMTSASSDDLVLRDLTLCEVIGETRGNLQNLLVQSEVLSGLENNPDLVKNISRIRDLMIPNMSNIVSYCKYRSPLYRDVDQLKSSLTQASDLFEELVKNLF